MKKLIIFIATLFICMSTMAKVTVTNVLRTIPKEIVPYIDDDRRDEIGRFSSVNVSLEIINSLNGTMRIWTVSDDFARMELSESSML